MFARRALVLLLILLLACPAWSNPGIVGTAAASRAATVRGNALLPGSTIFSGDTIEVAAKGSASIAVNGGAQVRVGPGSQVRLSREKETALLEIGRGSAAFRVTQSTPFEARLADATIRGTGKEPAVGVVLMRDAKTALIAAEKGELVVSTAYEGKSVTLKEGEGVEVTLAPAPQGGGGTAATTLAGKWVAILGTVVVGAVLAVALIRSATDNGLTDPQKRNEVSPFRFP